jgi:hypothetical protein
VGRRKFLERSGSTDIGNVAGCVPMVLVVAHREWTDSSMNRFERQDKIAVNTGSHVAWDMDSFLFVGDFDPITSQTTGRASFQKLTTLA